MSELGPSVIGGRELPARILHYIDGQHVESISGRTLAVDEPVSHRRYAELSAGDADDIDRAVAAAGRAFEEWSAISARRRSDVLRRIAESIERAGRRHRRLRVVRHRPAGEPGPRAGGAGGRELPLLLRGVRHDPRGRLPGRQPVRLRGPPPEGRGRPDHAVERPVHARHVEARAVPRRRLHRGAQAGRADPAVRRACSPRSSRRPALPTGVFNIVHGVGEEAGAALVAHPRVPVISFTGETPTGKLIMASACRAPQGPVDGARAASRRASSSPTPTSTLPSTARCSASSR